MSFEHVVKCLHEPDNPVPLDDPSSPQIVQSGPLTAKSPNSLTFSGIEEDIHSLKL
jgi:hypothetical protein